MMEAVETANKLSRFRNKVSGNTMNTQIPGKEIPSIQIIVPG